MSNRVKGFTLVELLVVVAIIALLISILLPSLTRAREQAKSTRCLANLKDLGAAANAYAADDKGDRLVPVHYKATIPLFQDFGTYDGIPGGTGGAYYVGDIQWGGKGGNPLLFNLGTGAQFGNMWAFTQTFGFGPGDRPLNRILYKNVINAGSSGPADLAAALADNRVEMELFHCPSDVGWESGGVGNAYVEGYVVLDRGFQLGDPHYEFTGNSYKNPMAWILTGEPKRPAYTTTVFNVPANQVYQPSRLVLFHEANAEDTWYFNRPELEGLADLEDGEIANWWVQGWHQRGAEIMEFNTSFADGHAGKMSQKVRSGFTGSNWSAEVLDFSHPTAIRGSRPEPIVPSWSPQAGYTGKIGYWGDKMYRGEGWMIDNAPAPAQLVCVADP